jgi:hypothetical protein
MAVRCCGCGSPADGDDDRCAERIDRRPGWVGDVASDVCADGAARHGCSGGLHADRSAANDDDADADAGTFANPGASANPGP